MKLKRIAIAVAAILFASSVQAQVPPPVLQQAPVFGSFYLGARSPDVSATTTSGTSAVALGTAAGVAYVCNTGSNNAYFRLGASTITVTAANGIPLIAGQCGNFYAIGSTHIVGITATSTATLQVAMGWGSAFAAGGGSGGGGGGSVTQGTIPWTIDTAASGNLYDAITSSVPCLNATAFNTNSYANGQTNPTNCTLNGNLFVNVANAPSVTATLAAGAALAGKFGIDQTILGTTNGVTDAPANSSPTNISATTSGTPSTATTLLSASATHHKVILKVEGASVVCFSQFGTAVIGSAGTWCLKGASSANAGDGGSYTTPPGMTEPNAISMISAGTSVLVTGWWQ